MTCQIGIYDSPDSSIDHWNTLIYLEYDRSSRDMLREIAPFLRDFVQDMADTGSLSAWFTWYLIDANLASARESFHIALSREIRSDIDFFYKLSPGAVEVYSIDEVLDWKLIATVEIAQETVEIGAC